MLRTLVDDKPLYCPHCGSHDLRRWNMPEAQGEPTLTEGPGDTTVVGQTIRIVHCARCRRCKRVAGLPEAEPVVEVG